MNNPEIVAIEICEDGMFGPEETEAKGRFLTFLVAPDLPPSDILTLENAYREVVADPTRSLVVNYNLSVNTVYIDSYSRLVVIAPDMPPAELDVFRAKVNDSTRDVIAVNYNIGFQQIAIEE